MAAPTLASGELLSASEVCPLKIQIQLDPSDDPSTTFTCFSKLPPEIRLKIWKFGLPRPIVINVAVHYVDETCSYFTLRIIPHKKFTKFGREHLFTCHESAQVFHETYSRLTFTRSAFRAGLDGVPSWSKYGEHDATGPNEAKTFSIGYVDRKNDTVAVAVAELVISGVELNLSRIENFALLIDTPSRHRDPTKTFRKMAKAACPSMKSFSIVVKQPQRHRRYSHDLQNLEFFALDQSLKEVDFFELFDSPRDQMFNLPSMPDYYRLKRQPLTDNTTI